MEVSSTGKYNLVQFILALAWAESPISHLVRSATAAAPRLQRILNHVIGRCGSVWLYCLALIGQNKGIGTFPRGSGFFCIHSQEPSRKVTFSFSRHSANLQVIYSDVFIEPLGAHTLLGTVIQLFIPASVHLNTDKPATVPRKWKCYFSARFLRMNAKKTWT